MTWKLRTHPLLALSLAVLALSACGGDDPAEPPVSSRTTPAGPTATPTPATTPSPTPTVTPAPEATAAPGPEQQEGGAGDEEGIAQSARFAYERSGRLAPERVEVAAFLPVRLTLRNDASSEVRVELPTLGVEPVVLGPGESRDIELSGPRTGRHELRAGGAVAILDATPGGPG
jgi:hypothetical protein